MEESKKELNRVKDFKGAEHSFIFSHILYLQSLSPLYRASTNGTNEKNMNMNPLTPKEVFNILTNQRLGR